MFEVQCFFLWFFCPDANAASWIVGDEDGTLAFICVAHLGSSEWVWGVDCLVAPLPHILVGVCAAMETVQHWKRAHTVLDHRCYILFPLDIRKCSCVYKLVFQK